MLKESLQLESDLSFNAELTALERTWKFYVQENNLPTARRELMKFFGLLFVSGGSALYGALAQKATENSPLWIQWSSILGTSLCAGIVLINSTNEFFLERNARRLPLPLRDIGQSASSLKYFLEDLAVVSVSALASVSLATTAWKYPKLPNTALQIVWVAYIETVNTVLHLWPVGLFIFGHRFYSLPLKPFQMLYQWIDHCLISAEEKEQRALIKFKRSVANELCAKIRDNLDKVTAHFISDSFEWNGFSHSTRQWLSYTKKQTTQADSIYSQSFSTVFQHHSSGLVEQKSHFSWRRWVGEKLQQISYVGGATLVTLSCIGYLVDPPYTLQDIGSPKNIAIAASIPPLYFLGVLLAHTGGLSLEADILRIGRVFHGKEPLPLSAKLHTKSFALGLLANVYITIFSPVGAMQAVRDHFTGSVFEEFFIECARVGIMYLSTASVSQFYAEYLTKFVRIHSGDENQLIAEAVERIAAFKRHLPAIDPDQLVFSLLKYSDEELEAILGMSKAEFEYKTDFQARLAEQQVKPKKSKSYCQKLSAFFNTGRPEGKMINRPLLSPINSL